MSEQINQENGPLTNETGIESFREKFRLGLVEALEHLKETPGIPLSSDFILEMTTDGRLYEELSVEEKEGVRELIYQELGLDSERMGEVRVREYVTFPSATATVPGEIKVVVFKTNREGVFLSELTFVDGEKRWVVGSDENV